MKVQDKPFPSLKNTASEEEGIAAKKIFSSLLLACKNISIYPPGHTTTLNTINLFHVQLFEFLNKYGALRLEVERDLITFKEGLISQGIPEEGSIHFALFQVGIRWLEFLPGIEPQESQGVLNILDRYSKLSGEADGDIVTALWEAEFPHLEYEVAEFSWVEDEEESKDISGLTREKAEGRIRTGYREEPEALDALDQTSLVLTEPEKATLKEMVRREEGEDWTSFLEILLDSLLQHREKENFNVILGVLSEEFKGSLARKDFIDSFKILYGLRHVLQICQAETPAAGQSLETFFLNISLESQATLTEIWSQLGSEDAGILGQVLKFLHPQAIDTLVSLLPQTQQTSLRQVLLDSIVLLASQDMGPLESALKKADETLIEKIIPVFVKLEGDQAMNTLMGLAGHPSAPVRHEAVRGIIRRDPARIKEIFYRIDNMDEATRLLILEQLGRVRDESVEDLILAYLPKLSFDKKEVEYLNACFKALGRCGSARSVPFLRETLFQGGVLFGFRRSALRKGAAIALVHLHSPEAERVLGDAGRSLNPSLRMVVGKIRRGLKPSGRSKGAKGK
jgi:hypothetical protein